MPNPYQSPAVDEADTPPAADPLPLGPLGWWRPAAGAAVCVAVFAIQQAWFDWSSVRQDDLAYLRVLLMLLSIFYGVGIASSTLFVWRSWQAGWKPPTLPGHWLLVNTAGLALLTGGVTAGLYTAEAITPIDAFTSWNLEKLLLCTLGGMVCLLSAQAMGREPGWPWLLRLPGLVLLALATLHVLALRGAWRPWYFTAHIYSQAATAAFFLVVLAVLVLRDRRRATRRDWAHYLGVGIMALLAVAALADSIYWLRSPNR